MALTAQDTAQDEAHDYPVALYSTPFLHESKL
jgi:hypothetical protein